MKVSVALAVRLTLSRHLCLQILSGAFPPQSDPTILKMLVLGPDRDHTSKNVINLDFSFLLDFFNGRNFDCS